MNTGGNWIASGLISHYMINSFAISGAVKVGPGLSVSLCLVVIVIFLFKGFQKNIQVFEHLIKNLKIYKNESKQKNIDNCGSIINSWDSSRYNKCCFWT